MFYTGNYPDDNKPGIFDSYDYYYAEFPGWEVPENMSMSCMADGASLTVYLAGEEGTVIVSWLHQRSLHNGLHAHPSCCRIETQSY